MIQQINLFQPIFRKQKKKFSATAMLQAMGLLVAGVLLLFGHSYWQVFQLRAEVRQAEQQLVAVTKQREDVMRRFGSRFEGRSVEDELSRLEKTVAERQQLQDVLRRGIFSNTDGFSDYMTAFARQHLQGVWLTGFHIVGAADQMSLRGRSNDPELVPRYLQRLSAEKRLSGIEFKAFQLLRPADAKARTDYVDFVVNTSGALEVPKP